MSVVLALLLAVQGSPELWIDPSLSADAADLIEFERVADAGAFGWGALPGAVLSTEEGAKIGTHALRAEAGPEPKEYMGIDLRHEVNLAGAGPGDRVILFVKQNFGDGLVINLRTENGHAHRFVEAKREQWTRVAVDLDLANWHQGDEAPADAWSKVEYLHIYSKGFDASDEYMLLDGFAVFVDGRPRVVRTAPQPE